MTLLSTDKLYERGRKESNVLEKTNAQPYRVGRRVFENGYLRYGPGDYVSKEEAIRLGIIPADEEETSEVEIPAVSANRTEWDEYAETVGLDPSEYSNKQALIDAVYAKQDETGESASDVQPNDTEVDSEVSSPDVTVDDSEDDSGSDSDSGPNLTVG